MNRYDSRSNALTTYSQKTLFPIIMLMVLLDILLLMYVLLGDNSVMLEDGVIFILFALLGIVGGIPLVFSFFQGSITPELHQLVVGIGYVNAFIFFLSAIFVAEEFTTFFIVASAVVIILSIHRAEPAQYDYSDLMSGSEKFSKSQSTAVFYLTLMFFGIILYSLYEIFKSYW